MTHVQTLALTGFVGGYRPPAPEAIVPMDQRPIMH